MGAGMMNIKKPWDVVHHHGFYPSYFKLHVRWLLYQTTGRATTLRVSIRTSAMRTSILSFWL